MYATRVPRIPASKQTALQLSKAVTSLVQCNGSAASITGLRLGGHHYHLKPTASRYFSSSPQSRLRDIFPEPDAPQILKTEPAWPHEEYTEKQITENVFFAHRKPKDFSDRVALGMVRLLRFVTDTATRYKHDVETPATIADTKPVQKTKPYSMSENKWLVRFIFLESVAGVPGMVAASLRHLHSLRRLKRDNGWIETLLEEAYNERMHLLTFLKMSEPGWFMRFMILGAQGVFYNSMFLSYLISPRTCHRFVGYLEEEAVLTYSLAVRDVEQGKLPKWSDPNFKIPDLAVEYWKMPEGKRTMKDLLLYIRADEAKHREVNHTLGNLKQQDDPNPFVSEYKGYNGHAGKLRPTKGIEHTGQRPVGWEREEVI